MDESRDPSDSRDLTRTTSPPKIIHHPTHRTYIKLDLGPPVINVNRSPRSPRRDHSLRSELAPNDAVPRTYQSQPTAWQQHPPSIDNAVRRSNIDNEIWAGNGVQDNAITTPPPVVHHGDLGELTYCGHHLI